MIGVTLISAPPNRVIDALKRHPYVNLRLINSLSEPLSSISHPDSAGLLLTYRCPCVIPREIYSRYQLGAYNLHPSLLPLYPGLNPWEQIFRDKATVGGVTLHRLSDIADAGEIIMQSSFSIAGDDTIASARDKADAVAASIICQFINDCISG